MSFESNFEAKLRARERELARARARARAAEIASSSDGDGSSRIDPVISIPGQRPAPEGLVIHVDDRIEAALSDTSWQDELGTRFTKPLVLNPEFNGQRCGSLYAEFTVVKDQSDGKTILDRYVRLGNVLITNTQRQGVLRKKGIGSALLEEMEKHARRFGASRIEGVISPIDLPETPTLPSFYENRGYEITLQANGYSKIVKPL